MTKFLSRRMEKKYLNQYLRCACDGCGRDHTKETRLESSRRRRVDSEMRRVRRRAYRQSPLSKWMLKEFKATLDSEMSKALFGTDELVVHMAPAPGVTFNFIKEAFPTSESIEWLVNWTEGNDKT